MELWHVTKKDAYPYLPLEQKRTLEDDSKFFHEKLLPGCDIWVAEHEGQLVGFLAIQGSYVDRLYVLTNVQGAGIGAALIKHAMTLSPNGLNCIRIRKTWALAGFTKNMASLRSISESVHRQKASQMLNTIGGLAHRAKSRGDMRPKTPLPPTAFGGG